MKSGCTQYIRTRAVINFTGDTICCDRCPLLETYARKMCRLTAEYIVDGRVTGAWCPLEIEPGLREVSDGLQ